jgi:glutaredoxin-like YruB-family protein
LKEEKVDKKVTVYSTSTCPYCKRAKGYLDGKGIIYEDIDVSSNPQAAEEMVKVSNQMSVPVIVIDNDVVIGFDKAKLDKLLG